MRKKIIKLLLSTYLPFLESDLFFKEHKLFDNTLQITLSLLLINDIILKPVKDHSLSIPPTSIHKGLLNHFEIINIFHKLFLPFIVLNDLLKDIALLLLLVLMLLFCFCLPFWLLLRLYQLLLLLAFLK